MILRLILLTFGLSGMICLAFAQNTARRWQDSLKLEVGTMATLATEDFQPFWIVSNQFGTISDQQWDFSTNLRMFNEHILNKKQLQEGTKRYPLKWSYTVDLYNNNHFKNVTFVEGNMKLNWRGWQFRVGRYREVIGEVDSSLSTGSLGISGNAIPIPKVSIAVPEYKAFPWTNGWLQFKGLFSHGWMGNERYFYSYLHEKAFYLRAGRGKFKVFGGIAHFAEWGGKRGDLQLDKSWKGFWNVVTVSEANDGSVPEGSTKRPNRAGDQRGILEFGADWESGFGYWHFYNQTPFESGTGLDIRNIDRLAGISLKWKDQNQLFKKILVEFIYSKQMESYGRESQSYYNNGAYKTGWEYQNMVVGTPLFLNRSRANNFLPVEPFNWHSSANPPGNANIISNRIVGFHLGGQYGQNGSLTFKTLLTFTAHYMDRSILSNELNEIFKQAYTKQEVIMRLSKKVELNAAVAADFGDFYNNIGGMFGLRYTVK